MRLINWVKGFEDLIELVFFDTDAGVGHFDDQRTAARLAAQAAVQRDAAAFGVFVGVGQQVDDNLPDAQRIGVHQQVAALHLAAEFDLLFTGQGGDFVGGLRDRFCASNGTMRNSIMPLSRCA